MTNLFRSLQSGPAIERVRYDVRTRLLTVVDVAQITPAMRRITLGGEDLADFESRGFDDHVKVLLPDGHGHAERRDYTPRRYDREARRLSIDFALHDAGPATMWARSAQKGDRLSIAGPKGSRVVSPEVRRWLMIGDETALPAIGRRFEEASDGTEITSLVAVGDAHEEQRFETKAVAHALWVHRPQLVASDATALLTTLRDVQLEPETFVWIAAEASVARAARDHLESRYQLKGWLKASGYWIAGQADAHDKLTSST